MQVALLLVCPTHHPVCSLGGGSSGEVSGACWCTVTCTGGAYRLPGKSPSSSHLPLTVADRAAQVPPTPPPLRPSLTHACGLAQSSASYTQGPGEGPGSRVQGPGFLLVHSIHPHLLHHHPALLHPPRPAHPARPAPPHPTPRPQRPVCLQI